MIHPALSAADRWCNENNPLLEAVFDWFWERGEWPQIKSLQRELDRHGREIDLDAAFQMPRLLGHVEQMRIVLLVRGMSRVPAAAPLLDAWAEAIRIAYARYTSDLEHPQLTRSDIEGELELDATTTQRLASILIRENWAFGGHTGEPEGFWVFDVETGVRTAAGATGVSNLIAARDAVEFPGSATTANEAPIVESEISADPEKARRVMVVYGRDTAMRKAMFDFLRALDLRPLEWEEMVRATGAATPYTGEVLNRALRDAQAVVVLFTPDDVARLRGDLLGGNDGAEEAELRGQPRPNVLFEAGLAFGMHPERTVLVEHGELRGLSDLSGRHVVRLPGGVERLRDLAGRLEQAGCAVNTDGADWLDETRFPASPVDDQEIRSAGTGKKPGG